MNEFDLIQHFFAAQKHRPDVLLGIGDDAALLTIPAHQSLVVSIDTLVAGVHFPVNTNPEDIGYKALAVNLSDLAAMGAEPAWATLALTLPNADENWLKQFCAGFFNLANQYQVQLIGGDTTRGPLTITVQAHGFVESKHVLRRDQAQVGDLIYVTGTLGDAGLALQQLQNNIPPNNYLLQRLNRPTPRIDMGLELTKISKCAIDISDGLAADLNHILVASKVGVKINVDQLPKNKHVTSELALTAGDDYELCFTIAPHYQNEVTKIAAKLNCPCTCIGIIEKPPGLRLQYADGSECNIALKGYQHFC